MASDTLVIWEPGKPDSAYALPNGQAAIDAIRAEGAQKRLTTLEDIRVLYPDAYQAGDRIYLHPSHQTMATTAPPPSSTPPPSSAPDPDADTDEDEEPDAMHKLGAVLAGLGVAAGASFVLLGALR